MGLRFEVVRNDLAARAQQVLERRGLDARRRLTDELIDGMTQMADGMRNDVPIRTGALHDSIEVAVEVNNRDEIVVTAGPRGIHYAGFVEFGTRFMSAQPYVRPNVEMFAPLIQARLQQSMEEL